MKNLIAITGATGFIGQKLVARHAENHDNILYLTRTNKLIDGAEAFVADVNSTLEKLQLFFEHVDILYHCVGELNDESAMRTTHVQGTQNLLNALAQSRLESKKDFHWIQLSSCGAYGQPTEHPAIPRYVDETTQDNPKGEYECTKTEADRLIIDFAEKHNWFKYTIIRPTNVFGVGMRSVAIRNMTHMIQKKLFFYVGHNQAIVNFVYVDDVVSALMLCGGNPKAFNQTFIVSNDCGLQACINKMADTLKVKKPSLIVNELVLRKLVSLLGKVVNLPLNGGKIDVLMRKTYYSSQKIKTLLGWQAGDVLSQFDQYLLAVNNKKTDEAT